MNRQILLDLFLTPLSLSTLAIGASLLLLSWALSLSGLWTFFGILFLLSSVGCSLSNAVFNFDKSVEKVMQKKKEASERQQQKELDTLQRLLVKDKDPRDHIFLKQLRVSYRDLKQDLDNGLRFRLDAEMIKQIDELFWGCVKELRHAYELLRESKRYKGKIKDRLFQERERLMAEVGKSVEMFINNVLDVRSLQYRDKTDLGKLREQLDHNLEISRRTEQQMRELNLEDQYREFLQ